MKVLVKFKLLCCMGIVLIQTGQLFGMSFLFRSPPKDIFEAIKRDDHAACKSFLESSENLEVRDKWGKTPLSHAAWHGQLSLCKLLIKNGADIKALDNEGQTPLHRAARNGYHLVCKLLLSEGVQVDPRNYKGSTPLHHASFRGQENVCKILIEHNAQVEATNNGGETPLHYACSRGQKHTCRILIERGANMVAEDSKGQTPLHFASKNGNDTLCRNLIFNGTHVDVQNSKGATPLHYASFEGHKDLCKSLIKYKADLEARTNDGRTPLHYATVQGNVQTCEVLLDCGANLNAQNGQGTTPVMLCCQNDNAELLSLFCDRYELITEIKDDILEGTALHWACHKNNFKFCKFLIGRGFDPNAIANTRTMLHLAAEINSPTLIEYFLARHVNPNRQDKEGNSVLHTACLNENEGIVEKLLLEKIKKNIELDSLNKLQRTPLHCAVLNGNSFIVRLLLTYGATPNLFDKYKKSPILYAAEKKNLEICQLLRKKLSGSEFNSVKNFAGQLARGNSELERFFGDYDFVPVLHDAPAAELQLEATSEKESEDQEIFLNYSPVECVQEAAVDEEQTTDDTLDQISLAACSDPDDT